MLINILHKDLLDDLKAIGYSEQRIEKFLKEHKFDWKKHSISLNPLETGKMEMYLGDRQGGRLSPNWGKE